MFFNDRSNFESKILNDLFFDGVKVPKIQNLPHPILRDGVKNTLRKIGSQKKSFFFTPFERGTMVHTAAKESVPVLRIFLDVVNVTAIKKKTVGKPRHN